MGQYEVCLIGVGGVGGVVLNELAKRGQSVIGLERFSEAHSFGSSHGQTRIFRKAYFEHPDYSPLLLEAGRGWAELEEQIGKQIYYETGLLQVGEAQGEVISGVLRSSREHQLDVHELTAVEIERRWPGFYVPESLVGVYEPAAGYLLVEECLQAYLDLARDGGAEIRTNVEVLALELGPKIRVVTSQGDIYAEQVIITAGSWAENFLDDLGLQFEVLRKSTFWFPTEEPLYQAQSGCPAFLYELQDGVYYGIPQHDAKGLKLAEHSGGQPVKDPTAINREVLREDEERVQSFAKKYLTKFDEQAYREHAVCMYTMSPDGHFILDRHPQHENVLFAAGLSGHGFKFVPVLGQALSDLAVEGSTDLPVDFLSLERFRS